MLSMFFAVLENPNDEPLFEIFYESDRKICLLFAVAGALGKESCGFVFFEFANKRSPPPRDKKKAPKGLGYFAVVK